MITRKSIHPSGFPSIPSICVRCRLLHTSTSTPSRRVPKPTPFVPNPSIFLSLIGRGLSKHASKFPNWPALFTMTSTQMKEAGIEPPRTRRYLLRWLEKFRRGEFGVGGDLEHVSEGGEAEIRVIEVPRLPQSVSTTSAENETTSSYNPTTLSLPPNTTRLIVNLPLGVSTPSPNSETSNLKKVKGLKLMRGAQITGPHVEWRKGSDGSIGILKPKEGMWEHRRGHKIDGGERRRAEVRFKKGVEEHRKAKV